MAYLLEKFWVPMVIACLLGLLIGQATCSRRQGSAQWTWMPFGIVCVAAGLFLALQSLVPGRPGLWLESGLLMMAAYLGGCCIGCYLNNVSIGPIAIVEVDPHLADYTMKVASVGTAAVPVRAEFVPYGATADTANAMSRTFALRSSATDYTMMTAAIGTTAAAAVAAARDPAIAANAALRRARLTNSDTYTLAVASIGTTAERTGVPDRASGRPAAAAPPSPGMRAQNGSAHRNSATAERPQGAGRTTDAALIPPVMASIAARAQGTVQAPAAKPAAAVVGRTGTDIGSGTVVAGGHKPPLLTAPRDGRKDDLTLIWGVADKLADRLNLMGIWHFEQIAEWTPEHVAWFEASMEGFVGRVERDKWIEQCRKLSEGWRPNGAAGQRPKS